MPDEAIDKRRKKSKYKYVGGPKVEKDKMEPTTNVLQAVANTLFDVENPTYESEQRNLYGPGGVLYKKRTTKSKKRKKNVK